ncbi:MAG: DNA translocase FtsK 4TM domain-containing protein, partial [Calditrichaeota bacterium]|nr:DNA translocase FtsK 4TM domain-containing protein [Calditrichota bacterium]
MVRQSVKSKSSKDLNHFKINPTIAGVIIIVLSILLFLALISYDRTDITTFSSLSDLFEGGKKHNLLGIVGANLARIFFEYTFGWCAIIFPAWFLYIGVQFYKHAEQNRFFKKDFVIYFQLAFIGALLLAMPESLRTLGHTVDYYPSGAIGGLAMDILVRMFGYTGAIAVFSSYVIALVLIYIPKSSYAVIFSKLKIDFTKFQRSQPLADYDGEVETEREVLLNDTDEEISDVSESEEFDSSLIKELGEEDESDQSEFQEVEIRQEEYDQPAEKTIREIQETIASSEEKTQVDELESIINAIEEVNNNKSQISTADTQPDKSETDHPSFSIEEEVHEKISSLDKAQKKLSKRERYNYPYVDILDDPVKSDHEISEEELWASARQLEEKLTDFKVEAKVVNVIAGPVITMFEIRPAIGVRVSKIESLMPDIALKMRARGIRFLG